MVLVDHTRTEEQDKELSTLAACHVIELTDLKQIPLSTQLFRITGDFFNTRDFKNWLDDGLNSEPGNILIHPATGLRFLIPA